MSALFFLNFFHIMLTCSYYNEQQFYSNNYWSQRRRRRRLTMYILSLYARVERRRAFKKVNGY